MTEAPPTSTMLDVARVTYTGLEDIHSGKRVAYSTGFHDLDYYLGGGFQPKELIIIAGRPSMGKTSLAIKLILGHAKKEIPVGFFSMDSGEEEIGRKYFAQNAKVSSLRLRSQREKLTKEEWGKLAHTTSKLIEVLKRVQVDTSCPLTTTELDAKATNMVSKHGVKIIYVDYIQLMIGKRGRTDNRQQEMTNISMALKALAKKLNIAVVGIAQLNRQVEQRDKKIPCIADLRESGSIEQEANIIILIYRAKFYNPDLPDDIVEAKIGKNKDGPVGTAKLRFVGQHMDFEEIGGVM